MCTLIVARHWHWHCPGPCSCGVDQCAWVGPLPSHNLLLPKVAILSATWIHSSSFLQPDLSERASLGFHFRVRVMSVPLFLSLSQFMPQSHRRRFHRVPMARSLGIMLRSRWWYTTFHTNYSHRCQRMVLEVSKDGARSGRCDQPLLHPTPKHDLL